MNCETGILEAIIEKCSMMLVDYGISLFIENGCTENDDAIGFVKIADYCNRLCERPIVGICYNIGYGNLIAKNIRNQLYQCREHLCKEHVNDNGGARDDKQMPYTFTQGRGALSTDWLIGQLIRIEFGGGMIFNTCGLFGQCPEALQTKFARLLRAMAIENSTIQLEERVDLGAQGNVVPSGHSFFIARTVLGWEQMRMYQFKKWEERNRKKYNNQFAFVYEWKGISNGDWERQFDFSLCENCNGKA